MIASILLQQEPIERLVDGRPTGIDLRPFRESRFAENAPLVSVGLGGGGVGMVPSAQIRPGGDAAAAR